MKDADGVRLLQWALPRLRLRWPGFRKVRKRVHKRIDRRLSELGLSHVAAYRAYLEHHGEEWQVLDAFCRIPISRFYRDRAVFEFLEREGLPQLAKQVTARGERRLRCWSIGCAAGEEPYSLAILWRARLAGRFPGLSLNILATDVDPIGLERARKGCYAPSSLKDLPGDLLDLALTHTAEGLCVREEYRVGVEFRRQDVRQEAPLELFDLVLCRNVVFTYFDTELQREVLERILTRLGPEGLIVIGGLEALPPEPRGIVPWNRKLGVYRRPGPMPARDAVLSVSAPRADSP